MLLIEIIIVIGAFIVLVSSGVLAAKSAVGFGRTAIRFMGAVEPKTMHIMHQAASAQRRAFSIMDTRDTLLVRVFRLRASFAKFLVIINAAAEAWRPVARVRKYLGI